MQGSILSRDLVDLSVKGYKLVGEYVRQDVTWTAMNVSTPEEEVRAAIPLDGDPLLDMGEGVSDYLWIRFPRAHGGAKRTCSANTGPRPTKQCC